MENELYEVLDNYKQALNMMLDKVEALEQQNQALQDKVSSLEGTLFNDILAPAQAEMERVAKEDRFNEFSDAYGEQLDPLAKQANAIEGDDFDFMHEAFDGYEALEPDENGNKPSQDEYVETLVSMTQDKINAIREAVGADEVEVKVDEEGETEVIADGENITEEVTDGDGEIKDEEEIKETLSDDTGEETETKEETETEIEDAPDEVAELEKALEEEAKKFK